MLDFFDEDFPLTKKQEEMIKAMEEAAKKAANAEGARPAYYVLPVDESPITADEPLPAAEPIVEAIPEAVPETVAEAVPEAVPEAVEEAAPEIVAEPIAEIPIEPIAKTVPETVPETVTESVPEIAAEPVAEIPVEPIAEAVPEAVPETVAEAVPEIAAAPLQDEPSLPKPEAAQSAKEDEEAAIKRIFQPIHEERDLPESDNQAFSYEYDGRYFAEEETPAYKYGASSYPRRRTRPAKSAEAKEGSITVSTKTLLKVGAVVAATAAAVKLLSKKD